MKYNIINPVDINGNLLRLPEYRLYGEIGQFDSHGYSYLQAREIRKKEMNQLMGLDKIVNSNNIVQKQ